MTQHLRPHGTFSIMRTDEVAECWDVPEEIYKALWRIVEDQEPIPNIEDSGPHDHIGHECLAKHWKKLDVSHQAVLNRLAREHPFF